MPGQEALLLAGMQSQASEGEKPKNQADVRQALGGQETDLPISQADGGSSAVVTMGLGLPAITKKLQEKMVSNAYVDFSERKKKLAQSLNS